MESSPVVRRDCPYWDVNRSPVFNGNSIRRRGTTETRSHRDSKEELNGIDFKTLKKTLCLGDSVVRVFKRRDEEPVNSICSCEER